MPHTLRRLTFLLSVVTFIIATSIAARAEEHEKKQLEIKTSSGSFKAANQADPAHLKLPIYPGSKLLKGDNDGGLDVNWSVSGKPSVRFVVAKYHSTDSVSRITDFYRKKLGKDVTKFTQKDEDGNTVFEIKRKMEQRVVSLKSVNEGTEIDLVHVEGLESGSED